ncbi:class III lanthionine synthetase LanKC [Streptomyces olivaceiscleroticus]|uniref:Class III lanthionine synthetase LanKC n=2 Tax=Streptomyces olivaceiscleroticus TaxID=68245 RepID=A0ABP3KDD4_9ACTN
MVVPAVPVGTSLCRERGANALPLPAIGDGPRNDAGVGMNPEYAAYCDADRWFYDAPRRVTEKQQGGGLFEEAACPAAPEGWEELHSGDWTALSPAGIRLPAQGWKIHVSAGLDNACTVLRTVTEYCFAQRIAFKFVPSRYLLHIKNAKYADRASSGKFITVYPVDDRHCEETARELDRLLAGEHGPYILSDLRWGDGPVHLRYGAFARRYCHGDNGELVPAVADPAGELVPDLRGPSFRLPEWVSPPEFLAPHLAARSAQSLTDLPYVIERALHFSNGGGVYAGRDRRTGRPVVLKEGRPHAGLAADGADAVSRLRREQWALERLAGLDCVPQVLDSFTLGEHHFLVLEYVEGTTLNTAFARQFPLSETDPPADRLAAHTEWAERMYGLVERAVRQVNDRGLVFGDLHMSNVMVSPDESSVTLLDFESASPAEEMRRQVVANPAFVAPADRRGTEIDRYALACLRLALFAPLTTLFPLDRTKAGHLADIIADRYPVRREALDRAVGEITGISPGTAPGTSPSATAVPSAPPAYLPVRPGDWPAARDSMVRAVLAAATPQRNDRYFPGDIAQFATPCGGQSFGYGTAGVLYALQSADVRCEDAEEWLLLRSKEPETGTPVGFYDGLSGIAWTLAGLGHRAAAAELAHLVARQPLDGLNTGLHSGLAGVGLALLELARLLEEPTLHDTALRCAQLTADRLSAEPVGNARAGLLHGAAGPALLFLRLHERTGDPALLDAAATALRSDLTRCVRDDRGALLVREPRRTMPYLGGGSVGIGMVLDDYLVHREDEEFATARTEIRQAARSSFYIQPGLFRGVAGLILHLARTSAPGDGRHQDVARQSELLAWHAIPYQGQLAFPGEQLSRLSMDLSTGTAGCLLALGSVHRPDRAHLPFLPPLRRPTGRSQPGADGK